MINTILQGDARELVKSIPDESIDLIFTDPPYPKEYLHLYGWLAEEAARVLKPGGFLLTYTGGLYLDKIMQMLGEHLTYFLDYVILHGLDSAMLWPRLTVKQHKSMLAYTKGNGKPRHRVLSVCRTAPLKDKHFHVWGQDKQPIAYYMDCFSSPGDTVWEPFCGGGTVPYVCKQLRRNFIAFEINPDTAEIARKRLETVQPLLIEDAAQILWEVPA